MKKKPGGKNQTFWNKEYRNKGGRNSHLALSTNPSEDLEKFTRWLQRKSGNEFLNPLARALDLGCGNGRNLIFLAQNFGIKGIGYDISGEAISQAKKLSKDLPIEYEIRSIAGEISLPDNSENFVLDMMTSHFLNQKERENLQDEIARVLKPGGWLFFKTFLLDEDKNAKRMLEENPAPEAGSYIHPEIGVAEHVSTQEEIVNNLSKNFTIHKILKSHRHLLRGHAAKRRSISVYAQKD